MAERSLLKSESSESFALLEKWAGLNQRCLRAFGQVVHQQTEGDRFKVPDPALITKAFVNWAFKAMEQPEAILHAQLELAQSYTELWQVAAKGKLGPVVEPERGDRRFRDERWDRDLGFNFLKQAYLLTARWLQTTVRRIEGVDENTAHKVNFYTRLWVDALAPSNFRPEQLCDDQPDGLSEDRAERWPDWAAWVARHGGDKVSARTPGGDKLSPLEDAPGSYVKVRLSV